MGNQTHILKLKKSMESGYRIQWTDHALNEFALTFEYLEINFSEKELRKLAFVIQKALKLISINPELFPLSKSQGARRVIVEI
ncbi:hypothetical protein [Cryomorpha ignava]|uniref:hypothetical protein n=1 Tax=Cryomorpha ignava TaxID=101383 RepID=UPI001EF8B999|nr:hypothetical protein [Cryomorpha ignava]